MTRLIDADALLKEIETLRSKKPSFMDNISDYAIFVMKSAVSFAPTVETTDDVLARINDRTGEVIIKNEFQESEWIARYYPTLKESYEGLNSPENGFGKTPLEAVKKLEESINAK